MVGSIASRVLACAIAVAASAGFVCATEATAATAASLPGSIVYDKNSNVYVTDGVTTRKVTTNGATPSADKEGSTGYLVPSESDDGSVVVAVRNQNLTSDSDDQNYLRGYLWVMDGFGHVIRKINPPQYAYDGSTTCGLPANSPQGIVNAQVSPDGKHIAYTIRELFETYSCSADASYRTTVVDITGAHPTSIDDGTGDFTAAEDLEIGSWADSTTLLIDRADFGSVEAYRVTLPGPSGTAWFGPSSYLDTAYMQPDMQHGIVATDGHSESAGQNVVRLWTSNGSSSSPTFKCGMTSPVNSKDALSDPSLAPDGSIVAFQDTNPDGTISLAAQGIYTASTTCDSPHLLVAGANDAYWSPAGIDPPPSVMITSHPSNPAGSTTASIGFTAYGSPLEVTCRLDSAPAKPCTSSATYSALSNGMHTATIVAADDTRTAQASYTWRVDTTKPVVNITAPTAAAITATSLKNNWTGRDTGSGVASYQQQIERARYTGGFGAWTNLGHAWTPSVTKTTVSGLHAGYTYCLRVKAVDYAGNSRYSSPRCFATALDDGSMSASSGWNHSTSRSYYGKSAATTRKKGASLTRTKAVLDRVGVVAKTCHGCGSVAVYVGSTKMGTISLSASSTHYRKILMLPKFKLRHGTVRIKVLTSGKPVTIDGLVISHS